jgi:hypothetical protein
MVVVVVVESTRCEQHVWCVQDERGWLVRAGAHALQDCASTHPGCLSWGGERHVCIKASPRPGEECCSTHSWARALSGFVSATSLH